MIMDKIKINQYVDFSKMIQGFWRANEWQYTDQELNRFINQLVDRGITTMDHADIYGIINVNLYLVKRYSYHLAYVMTFKLYLNVVLSYHLKLKRLLMVIAMIIVVNILFDQLTIHYNV